MGITICHRRWCKERVDTSKTHLQLQISENMEVLGTVISFLLFRPLVWAGESCRNDNSEHGFALVDHVYRSFFADRLVSCYMSCSMQPACQSLNYNLADKTCEFNNDTKHFRPKYFVEKPTYVYADNPDSGSVLFILFFFCYYYFFHIFFRKYFCVCVCFVLCPPFFSFFLTGKNLDTISGANAGTSRIDVFAKYL